MPRVGILTPADNDKTTIFEAFKQGLRALGYVEGRNIVLEFRSARGDVSHLPQLAAELAEQCHRLLDLLQDEDLRSIALLKMEGYTNEEIAKRLQCVPRTVERKLERIREKWSQESEQ